MSEKLFRYNTRFQDLTGDFKGRFAQADVTSEFARHHLNSTNSTTSQESAPSNNNSLNSHSDDRTNADKSAVNLRSTASGLISRPTQLSAVGAATSPNNVHHICPSPPPQHAISDRQAGGLNAVVRRAPGLDESYISRLEARLTEVESSEKSLKLRNQDLEAANASLLLRLNQLEEQNHTVSSPGNHRATAFSSVRYYSCSTLKFSFLFQLQQLVEQQAETIKCQALSKAQLEDKVS